MRGAPSTRMHAHTERETGSLSHISPFDSLRRSTGRACHRQLYVMETKMAETQLSADEATMWDAMKREYMSSHGLDEKN